MPAFATVSNLLVPVLLPDPANPLPKPGLRRHRIRSLLVYRLEQFHEALKEGRHFDGVPSQCNEAEVVLTEPLDVCPVSGDRAGVGNAQGVAVERDGCSPGPLGEGLQSSEGFWIPAEVVCALRVRRHGADGDLLHEAPSGSSPAT